MELAGGTYKEGGGGVMIFRNVLSGGGPGIITFWVGDLGFVWYDIPESGGGARGITETDNWAEGSEVEGRYLAKCDIIESP